MRYEQVSSHHHRNQQHFGGWLRPPPLWYYIPQSSLNLQTHAPSNSHLSFKKSRLRQNSQTKGKESLHIAAAPVCRCKSSHGESVFLLVRRLQFVFFIGGKSPTPRLHISRKSNSLSSCFGPIPNSLIGLGGESEKY